MFFQVLAGHPLKKIQLQKIDYFFSTFSNLFIVFNFFGIISVILYFSTCFFFLQIRKNKSFDNFQILFCNLSIVFSHFFNFFNFFPYTKIMQVSLRFFGNLKKNGFHIFSSQISCGLTSPPPPSSSHHWLENVLLSVYTTQATLKFSSYLKFTANLEEPSKTSSQNHVIVKFWKMRCYHCTKIPIILSHLRSTL